MKDIKTGEEKKASEMTTRELFRNLFPAAARAVVRREVSEDPKPAGKKSVIKPDRK